MEGEYLPGNVRERIQELLREHKITQAQLAERIGSTESAVSRFISGKTDKISAEHIIRIARAFNVSTDFLLGVVNIPDRKNYDVEELGLSVQAARNLYTGRVNAEIVNRLLESPRFAEVTYMIEQYFNDTLAEGFVAQNQMYATISAMLRRDVKTDAAVQAARDANRQRVPVYQADLTTIQNSFMAALKEVKRELGNDLTAAQALTEEVTQQMYASLTRGGDVQTAQVTPEPVRVSRHAERGGDGGRATRGARKTQQGARGVCAGHYGLREGEAGCRTMNGSARSHRPETPPRGNNCWSATWASSASWRGRFTGKQGRAAST